MPTSVAASDAVRLSSVLVEIPASARSDMRVPARVFADEELWHQILGDRTLGQLVNVASLEGVHECAYAMPDAHEGYGFPVGGVAAFRTEDGVVSPGGVGYDINCGVRLLAADLEAAAVADRMESIVHDLMRSVPSGVGRGGSVRLDDEELERVLAEGAGYLRERGEATGEDLAATEAGGSFADADPDRVSQRAKDRGRSQLGTIGSGNHFLEVLVVDRILDPEAAGVLGLAEGRLTVLIHTGSRGLGHQVCTDWVRTMDEAMPEYGIELPDRELACAPFTSTEGQGYYGAMCAAANYAFANRQMITHRVRRVFERALGEQGRLRLIYDVAHNMAKVETYGAERLVVHRKGATRAFGPSHPETPEQYRSVGQPVLIPGSMGTASYVLVGTDETERLSFGSCCHGAGRRMSRTRAKKIEPGHVIRKELEGRGIVVRCPRSSELAEEAPHAYKDVDRVVEVVERAGLARRVARLTPLGVVKG